MARADRKLFRLLDDEVNRDLLQLLLKKGGQTQRELTEALQINSGAVSRRMTRLEDEGLVERTSPRGPYAVVFAGQTGDLLLSAAKLADLLAAKHQGETLMLRSELEEEAIEVDPFDDRVREERA